MVIHRFDAADGGHVYISTAHVVAVREINGLVYIYTSVQNSNGWPFAFPVSNDIDTVLGKLREG